MSGLQHVVPLLKEEETGSEIVGTLSGLLKRTTLAVALSVSSGAPL